MKSVGTPIGAAFIVYKIVTCAVTVARMWAIVEVTAVQISIEAVWTELAMPGTSVRFIAAGTWAAVTFASIGAGLSIIMDIADLVLERKNLSNK